LLTWLRVGDTVTWTNLDQPGPRGVL